MKPHIQPLILFLLFVAIVVIFMYRMYVTYVPMQSVPTIVTNSSAEKSSVPNSEEELHEDDIVRFVKKMKNRGKPVLITVINDAYVPFAHSWLCNTMYMGIHDQVLLIVTDTKSGNELSRTWPSIKVVTVSGDGLHGDQDYSHAGYVRIMIMRTEIILKILELEAEMLVFEIDCYWQTNPIPECQSLVRGYDIGVIPVSGRKNIVGGGFLYMKPTGRMINMWSKLTERMKGLEKRIKSLDDKKAISEGDNDQMYLSDLIVRQYGGILVKELPLERFPDGKWFTMKDSQREKHRPLIINNNWIVGNKAKIDRAEQFHQWFWDSNSGHCETDLTILKTASL